MRRAGCVNCHCCEENRIIPWPTRSKRSPKRRTCRSRLGTVAVSPQGSGCPVTAEESPVPAVLEYIPYRKRDGTLPRDETMHPYMAARGYACVRVDMRGNGDSDGVMTDEYTEQELSDACEVIAWLAAQPWCSGAVGMMGKSWGGFNGLQTAALRPPALKAVVTVCSTTDRFEDDIHFKGGCLLGENIGWGAVMLSYSSRPPDPDLRADWREVWLQRLEADALLAPVWASHQARDAYWKHGSICEDWQAIEVPVLSIGGWADNDMNTVSHLVTNLQVPVQGIVGPWVHQYPHMAVPGPRAGFLQIALRWWDRWLKGDETAPRPTRPTAPMCFIGSPRSQRGPSARTLGCRTGLAFPTHHPRNAGAFAGRRPWRNGRIA